MSAPQRLLWTALAAALAGCAVPADPGARTARESLSALQADADVRAAAPQALADAERAVAAAETEQVDRYEAAHSAYVAQMRVLIAKYRARAINDGKAAVALVQRRDTMRHGNDAITTLSTDAFNATPKAQRFVPITKDTPFPVTAPPIGNAAAAAPPAAAPVAPVEYAAEVPAEPPAGPLLSLPGSAFKGDALTPAGKLSLDQALLPMAKFPERMIVISGTPGRASAVKAQLIAIGVPSYRLATSAVPGSAEVRLEFGGKSPG